MSEHLQAEFLRLIVGLLLIALSVHWAASIVLDRSRFSQALMVTVVGGLLAFVVAIGSDELGWPGAVKVVLALTAWALVAASFYKTQWAKGAIVGVAAWVIWVFVGLIVNLLVGAVS